MFGFTSLPRSLKIRAEAAVVGPGTAVSTDKDNRVKTPETSPIYGTSPIVDNGKK